MESNSITSPSEFNPHGICIVCGSELYDDQNTRVQHFTDEYNKLLKERENYTNTIHQLTHLESELIHCYKNKLLHILDILGGLEESLNYESWQKNYLKLGDVKLLIRNGINELDTWFKDLKVVETIDINFIVRKGLSMFIQNSKDLDISFVTSLNQNIPNLFLSEGKIIAIVYNLISNAVKAIQVTNRGKGQIYISTELIEITKSSYVQVAIKDNGIGIKKENYEKIMEKGFTTHRGDGLCGMGLFVVKNIVSEYGGRVVFESKLNEGTIFSIQIPL